MPAQCGAEILGMDDAAWDCTTGSQEAQILACFGQEDGCHFHRTADQGHYASTSADVVPL
jgi:hypothetical protein